MALNDFNRTDIYDTTLVGIMGGTTDARIGNMSDRLKVNAVSYSPLEIAYENAHLSRDSLIPLNTWVPIYKWAGYGEFYGFLINLESASGAEGTRWYFNLVIDDDKKIFGTNGLLFSDMTDANIYNLSSAFAGLSVYGNIARLELNNPIFFKSSVSVEIFRTGSIKKFKAGLVKIARGVL